jgi:hypothetical protein
VESSKATVARHDIHDPRGEGSYLGTRARHGTQVPDKRGRSLWRCAVGLLVLGSLAAAPLDEGDDRAAFVDGLYERGLYDMVAQESVAFLDKYEGHPRTDVIRYRLASALFELERKGEAVEHFRILTERQGFGFLWPSNWC